MEFLNLNTTQMVALAAAALAGVWKYALPVAKKHWTRPFGVDVPTPKEVERHAAWLEKVGEDDLAKRLRSLPISHFNGSMVEATPNG